VPAFVNLEIFIIFWFFEDGSQLPAESTPNYLFACSG
jgi:hypothetical protein